MIYWTGSKILTKIYGGYKLFKNIIVIGYGDITIKIFKKFLLENDNFNLSFIQYENNVFSTSELFCKDKGINFLFLNNSKKITQYFNKLEEKYLVISAFNKYLFPEFIVQKKNLSIINFHNALLPNYPGRNAPSWAIYNNEKETGITWHYVSNKIDAGDIIIQKKINIKRDVKAYELTGKLMGLAYEAFDEIFESLLNGTINTIANIKNNKLYKSTDIPNNGRISIDESTEKIYRLLRCMDYGKFLIFPKLIINLGNKEVEVLKYEVVNFKQKKLYYAKNEIYKNFKNREKSLKMKVRSL
jgi:methionyl-tRNA formyltransferase